MLKDRQHVGGRYVELFRVGRSEFHASLEQVPSPSASPSPSPSSEPERLAPARTTPSNQPTPLDPCTRACLLRPSTHSLHTGSLD
jgi:hypothetical protein